MLWRYLRRSMILPMIYLLPVPLPALLLPRRMEDHKVMASPSLTEACPNTHTAQALRLYNRNTRPHHQAGIQMVRQLSQTTLLTALSHPYLHATNNDWRL
jgi:hypothetical protein